MTLALLIIGFVLTFVTSWRRSTPAREETWPEWTVQTFGIVLVCVAFARMVT